MPNLIVLYKWVVDEADVKVEGDGALNFERASHKISAYDRNAIEAAVQIVEQHGGNVTAISLGGPDIKNSAKDCLSRGPNQAILALDPKFVEADSHITASGLVAAVKTAGAFDMIVCGEGSEDVYGQQVGPRVAEMLGIPSVTFANKLTVSEKSVIVERKLDDGVEVVEATFPVLVSVLPELNKPRIPGLKQIMGAAKKPLATKSAADLGLSEGELSPRIAVRSVKAPTSNRKQTMLKTPQELAQAIAGALR